jgi:hypothetical protein
MPKDIYEHLMAQQYRMKKGGEFTSIKVSVTPEEFHAMLSEITRKVGHRVQLSVIDIVIQLGQRPVIQIIGNKGVENVIEEKHPEPVKKVEVADAESQGQSGVVEEIDVKI